MVSPANVATGIEQDLDIVFDVMTSNQVVAKRGEMTRTISSGIGANSSYYLPQSVTNVEGSDWFSATSWTDKSLVVYADQLVEVDIYNCDTIEAATQPLNFYPVAVGPSAQLQILSASFQAGLYNSIETTLGLCKLQCKVATGGTPPTVIIMTMRMRMFG